MTSEHSKLSLEIQPLINYDIGVHLLEEQGKVRPLGTIRKSDRIKTPRRQSAKVTNGRGTPSKWVADIDPDFFNVSGAFLNHERNGLLKDNEYYSSILNERFPSARKASNRESSVPSKHLQETQYKLPPGHDIKYRRKKKVIHLPLFQINLEDIEANSKDTKSVEQTRSKLRSLIRAHSSQGERSAGLEFGAQPVGTFSDYKFVTPAEEVRKQDVYLNVISNDATNNVVKARNCSTAIPSSRSRLNPLVSPRSTTIGLLSQKADENFDMAFQETFAHGHRDSRLNNVRPAGSTGISDEESESTLRLNEAFPSKRTSVKHVSNKSNPSISHLSKTLDSRVSSAGALRSTVFQMDMPPESPGRASRSSKTNSSQYSSARPNTCGTDVLKPRRYIKDEDDLNSGASKINWNTDSSSNASEKKMPVLRYTSNKSTAFVNPVPKPLHSHSKCPMCLIGVDEEYDTSAMPCPPNSPQDVSPALSDDFGIKTVTDDDAMRSDEGNVDCMSDHGRFDPENYTQNTRTTRGTNTDQTDG